MTLTLLLSEIFMPSKSRVLHYALVIIWLALTSFVPMPAHGQNTTLRDLRYRIFDVGTFGGPTSQTNGGSRIVNDAGTVVGVADTAKACPYFPAFPVSPAFAWHDGVLKNIGLLPGGCFSLPNAISSNGLMAGSSDNGKIDSLTGLPELRGDFRINGRIFNLGTFGGTNSLSSDVNTHGLVVGAAENRDPDPFNFGGNIVGGLPSPTAWHAFLWREGTRIKDLGTLGGPDSFAFFVNQHDEIAGISFTNSVVNPSTGVPTLAPFFWKDGKMKNIGSLGGTFGTLQFLNEKSQMVGFSALPGDFNAHAYVWAPSKGMKDLGTLGGTFSVGDWINNKGVVVGGSTTLNDEAFIATRWRNGAIENLGIAGGNTCSSAFQISERGEVAGQSFNCDGTGVAHATLWEPTGPAIDLNVFLPPDSNLQLAETHFVNDHGELVVVGILPDGNPHIVVMVPCTGTEADGCRGAREDAHVAQQQLAFKNPTRLTPEALAAIKKRAMRRFPGFPGVPHT
jgi:probable HAF family extracellular repeat protein